MYTSGETSPMGPLSLQKQTPPRLRSTPIHLHEVQRIGGTAALRGDFVLARRVDGERAGFLLSNGVLQVLCINSINRYIYIYTYVL